MILKNDKVTLRHIKAEDIANYIHWTTVETEFMKWDAPWEWVEDPDPTEFIEWRKSLIERPSDYSLEIETSDGEHIGWVNSYDVDGDESKLAIGIDIPPLSARRKGFAYAALTLFMEYLFQTRDVLYTQTWSGNVRMIALAEKLGFKEVRRLKDLRFVDGKNYDGLTFAITKTEFYQNKGNE